METNVNRHFLLLPCPRLDSHIVHRWRIASTVTEGTCTEGLFTWFCSRAKVFTYWTY